MNKRGAPAATGFALLVVAWLAFLPDGRANVDSGRFSVIDLHVDLPYQITAKRRSPARGNGRYVAEWLTQSGVAAAVMPLYVPREVHPDGPQMSDLERVLSASKTALSGLRPWVVAQPPATTPCQNLAQRSGVAAFFSLEGATPLGFELASVQDWAQRGIRLFGLVHSYDTPVASSSGYKFRRPSYGLTRRGLELVRRIHAYGGVVDVSHASDAAIADILAMAEARSAVVVATHSNARAVANHPRNLTDPQIRAIAKSGGVVGIAFHAPFLSNAKEATLDDVVRHILHVKAVGGIEAVALGSDFEGGIRPPLELADVRGFPKLAQALLGAGLTRKHVRQIFSENARRVLCPVGRGH